MVLNELLQFDSLSELSFQIWKYVNSYKGIDFSKKHMGTKLSALL